MIAHSRQAGSSDMVPVTFLRVPPKSNISITVSYSNTEAQISTQAPALTLCILRLLKYFIYMLGLLPYIVSLWFIGKDGQKQAGRTHTCSNTHTHMKGAWFWRNLVGDSEKEKSGTQKDLDTAAWRHLLCGLQETEAVLNFETGEDFVQYHLRNPGVLLKDDQTRLSSYAL